jgi:hypothetical protein
MVLFGEHEYCEWHDHEKFAIFVPFTDVQAAKRVLRTLSEIQVLTGMGHLPEPEGCSPTFNFQPATCKLIQP